MSNNQCSTVVKVAYLLTHATSRGL